MSAEYPLYAPSEEHQEIRKAIREICDAKIAPAAAAVDEEARYPQEAHDALLETDFYAPHVPEQYGGVGADALATVIVIEEVARADVSASLRSQAIGTRAVARARPCAISTAAGGRRESASVTPSAPRA